MFFVMAKADSESDLEKIEKVGQGGRVMCPNGHMVVNDLLIPKLTVTIWQ